MKKLLKSLALCVLFLFITVCFQATTYGYEAGWEAVDEYNGLAPDLSECVNEGTNFQDAIASYGGYMGWWTSYGFADDNAWEEDFKEEIFGGTDDYYADNVNLVLFSGHGNRNGFYFGTFNDDPQLYYSEAKWGDHQDGLDWIIIDACEVLQPGGVPNVWNRWGWPVFRGLHYILGYSSITYDVNTRGRDFIKYAMEYGETVREAWRDATIISEDGTTAAYLRADNAISDTYNDHLRGFGHTSPDPVSPTILWYFWWSTNG